MAEVNVPIVNTPTTQPFVEQNLKELRLGRGSFSASKEGIFLGGETSDEAPFFVDIEGNMKATEGTFGGDLSAAGGTFSGEFSAGGGDFTISTSGVLQVKDSSGNVVIQIDPNG